MTRNFSRAFTMLELLIVIAVIAILATIAYPAFIGALERAKVTKDMNNLRQIGIATQLYMNDNDGALFSTTGSWMTQLYPKYTGAWGIFQSPFDTRAPPAAEPRLARKATASGSTRFSLICTLRPCLGRRLRLMQRTRQAIRTGTSVGPRTGLLIHSVCGNSRRRLSLFGARRLGFARG